MHDKRAESPDSTAVRVALWRAMHVQVDPPPHVLEDELGLRLAAPDEDRRSRPDMDPRATSYFRASIFTPAQMLTLAREAGFKEVRHISAADITQRYFAGRADGLRPPDNSEELLVAGT